MEILKSKEDPLDLFRDLLNLICAKFPAEDSSQDSGTFVRVSCSSHESNAVSVSTYGFLLLEAAENAMASTEQNLELVVVDTLSDHLLSAVASRLARQKGFDADTKVVVRSNIQCQGKESAIDISSLMQNCRSVELHGKLQVSKDIRKDGWAALREALTWRLHDIPHLDTGRKSFMASARREDLRAIWECLSLSWRFPGDQELFSKQRGEEGWTALEKFLDSTNDEWMAAKRAMGGIWGPYVQLQLADGQLVDLPGVDLNQMVVEMQQAFQQHPPEAQAQMMAMLFAPNAQMVGGQDQFEDADGQDQDGDGQGQEGDGQDQEGDGQDQEGDGQDQEGDGQDNEEDEEGGSNQ